MPAREGNLENMTQMLMDEAVSDAPRLAELAFGPDAFTDSKNVDRPEYLRFFRWAWEHGIVSPDGKQTPADEWRLKTLDRLGAENFWRDANEAYGLSPAKGLAMVRMAAEPPPMKELVLPPGPPDEMSPAPQMNLQVGWNPTPTFMGDMEQQNPALVPPVEAA